MTPGDPARVADIRARADAATGDPGCYGSAVSKASDLLYEVGSWLHDALVGDRDIEEVHDVLTPRLIPTADAALAELRAARADVPWLLDRLAAETERADKLDAAVAHYQGVLIATCAEKAEVQRREAELRARIEAVARPASEVVNASNAVADKYGMDRDVAHIVVAKVLGFFRAALSPAEEPK